MIIDAHMHADTRPIEDYRTMKMAGVDAVVACAHDPLEMKKSNVSFCPVCGAKLSANDKFCPECGKKL